MENKRINTSNQKHNLFQEHINLRNYIQTIEPQQKLKKTTRMKQFTNHEQGNFNVDRHFKYLKENHIHFQELHYQNQNQINRSYLTNERQYRMNSKSTKNLFNVERPSSIRKQDLSRSKVPNINRSYNGEDLYWNVKEATQKLGQWKK